MKNLLVLIFVLQSALLVSMVPLNHGKPCIISIQGKSSTIEEIARNISKRSQIAVNLDRFCSDTKIIRKNMRDVFSKNNYKRSNNSKLNASALSADEIFKMFKAAQKARQVGMMNNHSRYTQSAYEQIVYRVLAKRKK